MDMETTKHMIMPSGKFRGKDMSEIPSPYLRWVAENWKEDEIAEAADKEYAYREIWGKHFSDAEPEKKHAKCPNCGMVFEVGK